MQDKRRPARIVTIALWAFGLLAAALLSWLIPPMQSPDEESHIKRAYLISQGDFLLQSLAPDMAGVIDDKDTVAFKERARKHGGRIGGMIDLGLAHFVAVHLPLVREAGKRFSLAEKDLIAKINWQGIRHFQDLPGTGYYFPAIYAPQALGLAIGQRLKLSIQHSYDLAKGSTLVACFALLVLAFRLMTPNPVVAAMLLLPMSLFQLLSPTIDGLTTSLAVLAVTLFLTSIDRSRKHSLAASCGLAVCIFLLATSRAHLLPLLALPFYLAWQRQSRRDFFLGFLVAVATLAWILFALQTTNDPRIVRSQTTTQLLVHYAVNPAVFFEMVVASVADDGLFTFYERSFIGILGWLDTPLVEDFYQTLWAGLALCALASFSISTVQKDWRARVLLVAISVVSIGLIFLAMLVTWTPHPASVIKGVQGRYFVVPAVLLGYAASGYVTKQPPLRQWIAGLVVAVFALTSLTALTTALLGRYH